MPLHMRGRGAFARGMLVVPMGAHRGFRDFIRGFSRARKGKRTPSLNFPFPTPRGRSIGHLG